MAANPRRSNSIGANFEHRFYRKNIYIAVTRLRRVRMLSNHFDGALCFAIRDKQIKLYARHPVLLVAMSVTEFVKATSTLDNARIREREPTVVFDVCEKKLRPSSIHDCLNLFHETNEIAVAQDSSASLVQLGSAFGRTC